MYGYQLFSSINSTEDSSIITESVDSVCRDGTDMPYVAIQTEAWKTIIIRGGLILHVHPLYYLCKNSVLKRAYNTSWAYNT